MLEGVVNRLRGQVRVRVCAPFPERVLNLCAARKLALWDVRWAAADAFSCTLSRRDFYLLRLLARKLDCTLTVEKKQGAPFFIGRFRRRHALLAGLTLCAMGLFFGSFFIWDLTVDGAQTVPEEKILRALKENGVGFGTFGFSINGEELRNRVLLEVPELTWLTVNVSGCRAYVQVRERVPAPELMDRRVPSNIAARRDGLVLNVRALVGKKCVLPGDTVEQGQLLISGVEDMDTFGARMSASRGSVTARTWYRLETVLPTVRTEKQFTGRETAAYSLIFGTRRIKFYGNSSYFGASYDKITTRRQLSFFGLPLPVVVEREDCRFYEPQPAARSAAETEAAGEAALRAYLQSLMGEDGEIRSTLCTSRYSGEALRVTLTAECVEEIGEEIPIETADAALAAVR